MNFLTSLNLNKNELQNAVIHPLTMPPATPKEGQIYYNSTDKKLYQYNGSDWNPVGSVAYNQANSDTAVITGLGTDGSVNTTNVVSLKLGGYVPVDGGYVANNQTLQEAFSALDTAVKNAVSGGGEVNQNAFSNIASTQQSTNVETAVEGNSAPVTVSANAKTDTLNLNSGDKWSIVKADASTKSITLGHAFSGVTDGSYGDENNIPAITVDKAGHITAIENKNNPGLQYITTLSSDAQTQINAKLDADKVGATSGVCPLDENKLVPTANLPAYVDDVIDAYVVGDSPLAADWLSATDGGDPLTPEKGKIYLVVSEGEYQNKQYRWSGSAYVQVNASDVNSVNGKTGVVTLTQDDVGDGVTYVQYAKTDKEKLGAIEAEATKNNITLNGSVNANPTFYAPIDAGSSGQVLISNGSGAPTWQAAPQTVKKYSANNVEIVASGGSFDWEISASTHNIGNADMIISVYEISSGEKVMTEVIVNQSNFNVTIKINDVENTGTLTAGVYKVVMIG